MLQLYSWSTPNGYKPLILLHELGLPFQLHPIPLDGTQKSEAYLRLNPNGKIPTLRTAADDQAVTIFESGAILTYLAESAGQFLPADTAGRSQVLEWVFFQNAGIGPMFGQLGFFRRAEQPNPMALERYRKEACRLLAILEKRLGASPYLAGADYTIADITTHPWVRAIDMLGLEPGDYPALAAWVETIGARPAVKAAYATEFKPA